MLATENSRCKIFAALAVAALVILPGCAPSGPRALLNGDELLRAGKPAQAIDKLKRATELLPNEPRAWNLLGLAYHHADQPKLAAQAYQQALARDRSNRVAIAHYNFGCLLLEQNNPAAAAEHFRSYTLTTNSAIGLIKLATAQWRLRRPDLAEPTFGAALRLEPKNAEALNGVGVIHAAKNQRDAAQYFNAALQWNPKYAPAMLNAALLAQQNLATRSVALQRFKDYLAVAPQSPYVESVRTLVRQIEGEFAAQMASSNALVTAALKSNALVAAAHTDHPPPTTNALPRVAVATNKPPLVAVKTNVPPTAKTNPIVVATNLPPAPSNPPVMVVSVTNAPPPRIAVAEPVAPFTITNTPVAPPTTTAVAPITPDFSPAVAEPPAEERKPGFFTRLNPFRNKPKPPETNDVPRVVVLATPTSAPTPPSKPVFPRYTYLSPAAPRSGNRADAERVTAQAVKAERAHNTNEALLDYQLAVTADPSYFDAHYNEALLALRAGDFRRALTASEMALVIEPDSINARYNFALALKQANYANDAAAELDRILEAKPSEVRAHLTLANLYAQQLNDPAKAKAHYLKVIELDPRNPQASAIRFWLAANP